MEATLAHAGSTHRSTTYCPSSAEQTRRALSRWSGWTLTFIGSLIEHGRDKASHFFEA
jgi:hypothetical protein